uniref:Uncharacterized protein n=1 Tax=Anguilla anguilla TaxID=7936 RepID=A0A0E9XQG9_ANGAN
MHLRFDIVQKSKSNGHVRLKGSDHPYLHIFMSIYHNKLNILICIQIMGL